MITPSAILKITDPVNGSQEFVNGQIVSVFIDSSPIVDGFLLSEEISLPPSINDPRFKRTGPSQIELRALENTEATVYLWLKSVTDDINVDPITAKITVLPEEPAGTIQLRGRINSSAELLNDSADVVLDVSAGVMGYNISETQTTQPNIFSSDIPTSLDLTPASLHTIYLWLKDRNSKINATPIQQSFYTPDDKITAHRPDVIFVDENNQGLTPSSRNLRCVNKNGDWIQWNNIRFNPIGQNFSRFRFERETNGFLIKSDIDLLNKSENWESLETNLTNTIGLNVTIFIEDKLAYTNNQFYSDSTVQSINVTTESIKIKFKTLATGSVRIFNFISDADNNVTLEFDEYDYKFLNRILKHFPTLKTNYDALSDTQFNAAPALSEPIGIVSPLNFNDLTFLTIFSQAEITFSQEKLDRLEDFGFVGIHYITATIDPLQTIAPTTHVDINSTLIVPRCPRYGTNSNEIALEFDIINAPNTFAEFTFQISADEEFSNPTTLAFRTNETDGRLTITGLGTQSGIFLDNSTSFGTGTVYWRIRRNQSEYSQPCIFVIRSAPVATLEFTLDSVFSAEIGTQATIKVLALDNLSQPIEGARIDFEVSAGTVQNVSHTTSGVAPAIATMPITKQTFSISAKSENVTITHDVNSLDSSHEESKISFDRQTGIPPTVRYTIYRKLLAEVRDKNEEKIMLVSQTATSPIVRRDAVDIQTGTVFDPERKKLAMARDLLPPKTVRTPNIVPDNCQLRINWQQGSERGTTWHYDATATNNQGVEGQSLSNPTGYKFDVLHAGLANATIISPSPNPTHGETFPAYLVEKISANKSTPDNFIGPTPLDTNIVDDIGVTATPPPIINPTIILNGQMIEISWTNPAATSILRNDIYRIRNFDIAGNNSVSQILRPTSVPHCITGVLITKINSTECFETKTQCHSLNCSIPLAHGSILVDSVIITKLPECIRLINGTDYQIISIGNENDQIRGTIKFFDTSIIDPGDTVSIAYKYGRAITCGALPTPYDEIVSPFDGTIFGGANTIDTANDAVRTPDGVSYTYGIWTINSSGQLSDGQFVQILTGV